MDINHIEKLQAEAQERIQKDLPDFFEIYTTAKKGLSTVAINFISNFITQNYSEELYLNKFKLDIVVDNNFVFGQIKGAIKNKTDIKETLIFKMCTLGLFNIYAPNAFKKELISKIKNILLKDTELALSFAKIILAYIIIKDSNWSVDWLKATREIANPDNNKNDRDDVPYLALCFSENPHALVSNDKVFNYASNVTTINRTEMGAIMSNYQNGFTSLFITGTIGSIIISLMKLLFVIFYEVILLLIALFKFVFNIVEKCITLAQALPSNVLLLITGVLAFFYFCNKKFKAFIHHTLKKGKEKLTQSYESLEKFMKDIYEFIHTNSKNILPTTKKSIDIFSFIFLEFSKLDLKLNELNELRNRNNFTTYS